MPLRDRLQLSFNEIDGDLLEKVTTMKAQYDQEILSAKDHFLTNPKSTKNKECFYNGILKREFKSNKLSYYICRCDLGYLGDNCQISKDLYFQTQKKLTDFLNKLQKKISSSDKKSKHIFLQALSIINKFKLSRQIIEEVYSLVETFIQKNSEAENKKRLYSIYDGILLNSFDLVEDIQKYPQEEIFADSFLQKELQDIQDFTIKVTEKLKLSVQDYQQDNLLLPDSNFKLNSLNTHSFIIEEFNMATYDQQIGFAIRNPNIDTSFHTIQQNGIWVTFDSPTEKGDYSRKIRVINFASPLFELQLKKRKESPISNLVHLYFLQSMNLRDGFKMVDLKPKNFRIDFALNYLPVYDNILNEVSCSGFFVERGGRDVVGKAVDFNEDRNVLTCEFNVYFEPSHYLFGVAIRSKDNFY